MPALLGFRPRKRRSVRSRIRLGATARSRPDWLNALNSNDWSAEDIGRIMVSCHSSGRPGIWLRRKAMRSRPGIEEHTAFTRGMTPRWRVMPSNVLQTHASGRGARRLRMALHHKVIMNPGLLMDALQGWIESRGERARSFTDSWRSVRHSSPLPGIAEGVEGEPPAWTCSGWRTSNGLSGLLGRPPGVGRYSHKMLRDQADFFARSLD